MVSTCIFIFIVLAAFFGFVLFSLAAYLLIRVLSTTGLAMMQGLQLRLQQEGLCLHIQAVGHLPQVLRELQRVAV